MMRLRQQLTPPRILSLLLLALLATVAACNGSSGGETPGPATTGTPPALSPDLAAAAEFATLGQYEEAIEVYGTTIAEGPAEDRLAARVGLAQVYLDDRQEDAAVAQLETYLVEAPPEADVLRAQFLLAEALARKEDWSGALSLYDGYIEASGPVAVYARLGRVEALLRLDRVLEAGDEAEALLGESLPRSALAALARRVAEALEPSQPGAALAWWERLGDTSASASEKALALWRAALIRRDQGDASATGDAWATIMQRYADSATAREIVDAFAPEEVSLDPVHTGHVLFHARRDADARRDLMASIERNEDGDRSLAANAAYYLARLDERAGNASAAIAGYKRTVDLDASIDSAGDALWRRARLLSNNGSATEAIASYRRLAEQFDSQRAADARFLLALFELDGGLADEAAEAFAEIAARAIGEERWRALLWQGKALDAGGDGDAARTAWSALEQEAPFDHYGLRSAVLLGRPVESLQSADLADPPLVDWAVIDRWLQATFGEDGSAVRATILFSERFVLAKELLDLGMRDRAAAELAVLLEEAGGSPAELMLLAQRYDSLGLADLAARAALRLLAAAPEAVAASAPDDLRRLAYPMPFLPAVAAAAEAEGISPLLLYALVRQESLFDPLAGSTAGALGLTQVIAPTGEDIASALGVTSFEPADLFRPALSLRFGAYYLQEQMQAFGESAQYALAAYNAGPGNAQVWLARAGDDVDRFVEEIAFAETKAYVKLVLEHLARYRQLY